MRRVGFVIVVHALILTSACSRRVPLAYDYPSPRLVPAGPVVVCQPVQDRRTDRSIDDALEERSALPGVERALRDELASAGMAERVVAASGAPPNDGATLIVEPALERLRWEVPGYERIQTTVLVVSIVSGGIGGLIYGLTPTDVLGDARVTIRLLAPRSKREMTKTYTGSSRDRMAKLSSDAKATRSEAAAKALQSALRDFRADAAAFAASGQDR